MFFACYLERFRILNKQSWVYTWGITHTHTHRLCPSMFFFPHKPTGPGFAFVRHVIQLYFCLTSLMGKLFSLYNIFEFGTVFQSSMKVSGLLFWHIWHYSFYTPLAESQRLQEIMKKQDIRRRLGVLCSITSSKKPWLAQSLLSWLTW